jgi:hypothetical protein
VLTFISLGASFAFYLEKTPQEVTSKQKNKVAKQDVLLLKKKAIVAVNNVTQTISPSIEIEVRESAYIEPFSESEDDIDTRTSRLDIEPAASFHIDMNAMREMQPGDTFVLPEMDGEIIELVIVKSKKEKSGIYRISAESPGKEENSHDFAIITLGNKTASFSIRNKEKQYSGRSINGGGYFYRTADIKKSNKDKRIKSDEYYPPIKQVK